MSITHHPPEELIASFAAGTLDQAQHIVVAAHAARCPHCRGLISAAEVIAGDTLEESATVAMSDNAFDAVQKRLADAPARPRARATDDAQPGAAPLPDFLRNYPMSGWKWVAPSVRFRPILLPGVSDSRAFLLKSGPGTRMLNHTHTGIELTCVLAGRFSHEAGEFGPGDFDYGDDTLDHQPIVGGDTDCLCIVAMTGELRLNGWLGRIIQPFVRL